jgi:flagellar FliJ protein
MKKFQFKLQAVLIVRQRAEQVALELYGRAVLNRQEAMRMLTEIEHRLVKMRQEWQEQMRAGCSGGHLREAQGFDQVLEVERQRRDRVLARAEIEVNQAFLKVVRSRQQREMVETHRAHQRSRYDQAVGVEERKEIDDMINSRASTLGAWRSASDLKPS